MAKDDPVKASEFRRTLENLLSTPHKPQSEMKVGKAKMKTKRVRGTSRGDGGSARAGRHSESP
jgi:hypothetical protein